jgi:lipopolysaccharide export LptBFGC system permease protein LptF
MRISITLYRKLLSEFLIFFLLIYVATTTLLLIQQVTRASQSFEILDDSPQTLLRLLALILPGISIITLPISGTIATALTLNRLLTDNEYTAISATAISPAIIHITFLIPAIAVSAGLLTITSKTVPRNLGKINELKRDIIRKAIEKPLASQSINTSFPDTILFIRNLHQETGEYRGIVLIRKIATEQNGHQYVTLFADSGKISFQSSAKNQPQQPLEANLELSHGAILLQGNSLLDIPSVTSFSKYVVRFPVRQENTFATSIQSLSDSELRQIISRNNIEKKQLIASELELGKRRSLPFATLFLVMACTAIRLRILTDKHKGKVTGIWLALLLTFTYYLSTTACQSIAQSERLPPDIAIWLPNLLLLLIIIIIAVTDFKIRTTTPLFKRKTFFPKNHSAPTPPEKYKRPLTSLINRNLITTLQSFLLPSIALLAITITIFTLFDIVPSAIRTKSSFWSILTYCIYLFPQIAAFSIPPSVFIATLATLTFLQRSGQLTIYSASGIRNRQILFTCITPALILSAILLYLNDRILPFTNRLQDALYHEIKGKKIDIAETVFNRKWVVSDNKYLLAIKETTENTELADINIYQLPLSSNTAIAETHYIFSSSIAKPHFAGNKNNWDMYSGWVATLSDNNKNTAIKMLERNQTHPLPEIPEGLNILKRTLTESSKLSYRDLRKYILDLEESKLTVTSLKLDYQRKLAVVFLPVSASLLSLTFLSVIIRKRYAKALLSALMAYLFYLSADYFLDSLGRNSLIPVWMSAWGAISVSTLYSLYKITKL